VQRVPDCGHQRPHKDLREVQLYVDAYNRKKAGAEAMAMLIEAQSRNAVCLIGKDI